MSGVHPRGLRQVHHHTPGLGAPVLEGPPPRPLLRPALGRGQLVAEARAGGDAAEGRLVRVGGAFGAALGRGVHEEGPTEVRTPRGAVAYGAAVGHGWRNDDRRRLWSLRLLAGLDFTSLLLEVEGLGGGRRGGEMIQSFKKRLIIKRVACLIDQKILPSHNHFYTVAPYLFISRYKSLWFHHVQGFWT